ncbi:MAG: Hsp20 family protein [Alphaproteobacteria bacterium]
MSRLSLFNSPLLLGFDQFEQTLERISKLSAEGYPPYNVEQIGEDGLRLTLAVAGFTSDGLDISIEDRQLGIRGRQRSEPERVYLYRGIAARQFQRNFVLAEGIEVTGATLDNGLLHINLARPKAVKSVRTIEIKSAGSRANGAGAETIDVTPER